MSEFEALSWTESTLRDFSLEQGIVTFQMFDLVSSSPRNYELVNVSIQGIKAFELHLSPQTNGVFQPTECPIKIGELSESCQVFEGSMKSSTLSKANADWFWVTWLFYADEVRI